MDLLSYFLSYGHPLFLINKGKINLRLLYMGSNIKDNILRSHILASSCSLQDFSTQYSQLNHLLSSYPKRGDC